MIVHTFPGGRARFDISITAARQNGQRRLKSRNCAMPVTILTPESVIEIRPRVRATTGGAAGGVFFFVYIIIYACNPKIMAVFKYTSVF